MWSGMRGIAMGWLLVVVAGAAALTTAGDQLTAVVHYLLVWLLASVLPGVLLWRALTRPTTIVQEVGFGSVLGIALLLLAWLPATLVHRPMLMWLLPAGMITVFTSVPGLRRHWRPRRAPGLGTPRRWHVAMMLVCGIAFLRLYYVILHVWRLPPAGTSTVFQDAWNELSMTQALKHAVVIDDPAAAGVRLHYHWFSNAHAAATQELSGVPTAEVVLHLWVVMMLMTLLFATAAATERILQGSAVRADVRWWAGPVAALLAGALPATLFLGFPRLPAINDGFVPSSTSGTLALVVVLAFVGPTLDLLHGVGRKGSWLILLLLIALSAGTKPSLLPVIACGGFVVGVVEWARTRRFPRVPAMLTVLPVAVIPIAALSVIGSTGGSRPQLFEVLALDPAFMQAAGSAIGLPGHGGWLAPGLADGPPRIWLVSLGLLVLYLLTELPRLIGLLSPLNRELRRDLGTWWCVGVVGSGFAGLWALAHPGYSQHYFWRIVIALGIVMTVSMVVRMLPDPLCQAELSPSVRGPLVTTALAGIATAVVLTVLDPVPALSLPLTPIPLAAYAVGGRIMPYLAAFAVLAVVAWLLFRASARLNWAHVPVMALTAVFFCAAGATVAGGDLVRTVHYRTELSAVAPHGQRYVSAAEQRAALWLNANSAADDVVATNVFCVPVHYRAGCYHSSFWVPALTGRQLFVGSWAYTEQSLKSYGQGRDVDYRRTASPWPDRVALSLDAVRSPSAAVIAQLRRRGVTWIFADRRSTVIAPALKNFATLRYRNAMVQIYHIDQGRDCHGNC